MSGCRLNPKFKTKLAFLGRLLLQLLGILTVYVGLISVIGSFMYVIDAHELMLNLITSYGKHISYVPNIYMYILKAGQSMFWIIIGILIIITAIILIILLLYVLISKSYKSYRMQSLELSYKFEGVKQPWYRVLLSYIIVCDRTV